MKTQKITRSIIYTGVSLALFTLMTIPAYAQTASSSTAKTERVAQRLSQTMANQRDRAQQEITRRIDALNGLITRIQDMKNVSVASKASLNSQVQSIISNLNTLETKINTDTDEATLKADFKSVVDSYRIFMLVLPRTRIMASADRLTTINNSLNIVGTKLQTRINEAQTAGKDVTSLLTTLADYSSKVSDSLTQATAADAHIANLVPDQGDKTIMDSNTTALKQSRSDLKVAQQDIVTARQDAKTIMQGLKAFKLSVSTSTNTAQ